MADASIIDIGGTQWNVKDKEARQKVLDLENKMKLITKETFTGTFNFEARLKYLGEDDTYIFYSFWWPKTNRIFQATNSYISIYPPNRNTDIIESIQLGLWQTGNFDITAGLQDPTGSRKEGYNIHFLNQTSDKNFWFSAMGYINRLK